MNLPFRFPEPPKDGIEKPKRLRDYPRYIATVTGGFFKRLFYIISLVWQAAPAMLITMALICILDGILPVVGAFISKELLNGIADLITDRTSIGEDVIAALRPIFFIFLLYFIYLFVHKIISHVSSTVTGITGELVVNHIKVKIIEKAKTVDLASFDSPTFYEKLENANREAGMRPVHILTATFNITSYVISTVSFIAVLATLSPIAPAIIIIAAVPGAAVNFSYRRKSFRYIRHHSVERRAMNYYSNLITDKDMAKEIRLLGLGDTVISRYKKVFARYYAGLRRLMIKEGITRTVVGLISAAATCGMFVFVAYNIVTGEGGEIGDYSLYTGALTSISSYVTSIMASSASIYEGTLFINNMMDFMSGEPKIVAITDTPKAVSHGTPHEIELRNVTFRYPGTEVNVIENLSLTLKTPDSVVLVGLNGAGKTTLIKLLTRLYDPTEGTILLDGVDIREYEPADLYSIFGIVFQDYGKYAESASDNIAFGDVSREPDERAIRAAAEKSGAGGYIEKLPQGYDTPLTRLFSDDGIELSGGQWQKLAIARAFYKDSDILILDEPTASLDAIAEQEVFDSFDALSRDKLTVFVSHRLSGAVTASKIVVLKDGKLAELGTHKELMDKQGEYYKLFTTQAKRYR